MKYRVLSIMAAALLLAGCAGNPGDIRVAVRMMGAANDVAPGLHYVQATGGFNIAPLNSIIYKHAEKKADGSDITVLVSSASPEFWADLAKIVTGGVLNVGQAAILGVSFPAAKMAVNQANSQIGGGATVGDTKATVGDTKATVGDTKATVGDTKAEATGGGGGCASSVSTGSNSGTVTGGCK